MVGLKKIQVPFTKTELTIENIIKCLPDIMSNVWENKRKIEKNYEIYKGQHDIIQKTRPFADSENINNKVVEQHLWAMVNFKCGYIYGNPLEFAEKGTAKSEEMKLFNNYLASVDFRGKIDNMVEWVYACGVGYLFVMPAKSENKVEDAPYKISFVESKRCCKVYSSYIDTEPLFDIIITPVQSVENGKILEYNILSVYTNDYYLEFRYGYDGVGAVSAPDKIEERKEYKLLPLIEFYAYQDRIGIVESCLSLQNALDSIDSNSLDNIQEFVNQMLVIKNASLGETSEDKRTNLMEAKRNGVIEITDAGKDTPADIKTLTIQLNNSDVNVLKNKLQADMYGSWGVPLSSLSISSGNVTQGGSEMAGGWEHAYSVALKENNNMLTGLNDLIKHILWIERNTPDIPMESLLFSDIEIKWNIARSNNLQVKTQSFTYLVEHNVPYDIAWATCELSGDPKAIGKMIQDNADKQKATEEQEKTVEIS